MESEYWTYFIWATGIGALSAVSLPLGSVVGLAARFRPLTLSLLAAFGAGALIAALSVELVAPNVSALQHGGGGSVHADAYRNFLALIVGAICGGVAFVVLDQVVNAHGGFLRKTASTLAYFQMQKRARVEQLIKEAAEVPFLQDVPPHDVHRLASIVRPVTFTRGEVLFEQGDTADALIFIRSGSVRFTDHGQHLTEMTARNVLGAIELLTGAAHPVTAVANESVECLYISKEQFDEFRKISPAFDEACRKVASEHLEILKEYHARETRQAQEWAQEAIQSLRMGTEPPTTIELLRARQEHRGAPLAVWLGILLDGIPESLVIGFGVLTMLSARLTSTGSVAIGEVIPYTLVAGLFLSNFPEALSSSANMRDQGWSNSTIFNLWFSLTVITALGAGLGYMVGETLPHAWRVFSEGMAAGAMLTMIASTMIPDAVHSGNPPAVGLGTLAGFLSAIAFKLLE